jgi:hypothetical protein
MKSILWLLPALVAFATASSAQTRSTVTLTFAFGQSTVTEGQGGAGVLVVRRSQGTEDSLRVFYRLSGNARNGVDYERLSGSVEIPAGSGEATIEIIPLDDSRREPTERVTVQLRPAPRNSPQYRLGGRRAQVIQILDDEQPSAPRPPPGVGRPPAWFPTPGLITTNAPATP